MMSCVSLGQPPVLGWSTLVMSILFQHFDEHLDKHLDKHLDEHLDEYLDEYVHKYFVCEPYVS